MNFSYYAPPLRLVCIIFMLFFFGRGYGQTLIYPRDVSVVLKDFENRTISPLRKMELLHELSVLEFKKKGSINFNAAKEGLNLALEHHNQLLEAAFRHYLANRYYQNSEILSAEKELERCIEINTSFKNHYGLILNYKLLGICAYYKRDSETALLQYNRALELAETHKIHEQISPLLNNIGLVYKAQGDHTKALECYLQAEKADKGKSPSVETVALLRSIGNVYKDRSQFSQAIDYFQKAIDLSKSIKEFELLAECQYYLGALYLDLEDYQEAYRCLEEALGYRSMLRSKRIESQILLAISVALNRPENVDKSIEYLNQALDLNIAINNRNGIAICSDHLATRYYGEKLYKKSWEFHSKALDILKALGDQKSEATVRFHMAIWCAEVPDSAFAHSNQDLNRRNQVTLEYLDLALVTFQKLQDAQALSKIWKYYSEVYAKLEQYKDAYNAFKMHLKFQEALTGEAIRKEMARKEIAYVFAKKEDSMVFIEQSIKSELERERLLGIEKQNSLEIAEKSLALSDKEKALSRLAFLKEKAEKEDRQKALTLVEKEKKYQDSLLKEKVLENRVTFIGMLASLFLALIIAYGWRRVSEEKKRSDRLLLSILPKDVAKELMTYGKAEPKTLKDISILFTDFKDFSKMSEQMGAGQLVSLLNDYYKAFDEIVKQHAVEKIKTIGDSYMAAGGLTEGGKKAAIQTVNVALDILEFVEQFARENKAHGLHFEIRIGIHTGDVVAGVVGTDKFQYDLWGDSVNIAARMESAGVPGKLNISKSTYEWIKDQPEYWFEARGPLEVKSKGMVEMYFVHRHLANHLKSA